jgi:hypothetical protein
MPTLIRSGHLHFALQPWWNDLQRDHQRPGTFPQVDMFEARVQPPREKIAAFSAEAREVVIYVRNCD